MATYKFVKLSALSAALLSGVHSRPHRCRSTSALLRSAPMATMTTLRTAALHTATTDPIGLTAASLSARVHGSTGPTASTVTSITATIHITATAAPTLSAANSPSLTSTRMKRETDRATLARHNITARENIAPARRVASTVVAVAASPASAVGE